VSTSSDCYACRLIRGEEPLPGGRIWATQHWLVEHCTGPLGVGTLIVKPFRHCLSIADLTAAEAAELGPLLQQVSQAVRVIAEADQVYVCLWSHAGWQAVHIHFVVQPAWNRWQERYRRGGPAIQAAMFEAGEAPSIAEIERVCADARRLLGGDAAG
jgi:diadenosine tetraphosphate (Ap4A) HIT family hydrolase